MEKDKILNTLEHMVESLLEKNIPDYDTDLFGRSISISPTIMVYLLFEIEKEFHVQINDHFIDLLPSVTLNHLADAVAEYTA